MSDTTKWGLGRGLTALIPQDFDSSLLLKEDERIQKLPTMQLQPHSNQPRRYFDETNLNELAASIKTHGVLQPLIVTPLGDNKYRIVAGERRWRAAQKAGLKSVPAIVRTMRELEQLEVALIENVQRVDLNPLEQAASLERLHTQFSTPYEEIAKRLGKASSTVNNIVRLLQLPKEAQIALAEQKISEGHARTILSLKDLPKKQAELLATILKHGWSVRQAERYVTSIKAGVSETKAAHARVQTETPATKTLSKKLGSPVTVRRMAHGGKLEIGFTTDRDLEKLLALLSSLLEKS
ncbi:MAG TPA: ParB/RepB/Spo0J family partition protein [Candidatus Saccharimonadales bacterium]|nr:ParB/RepB/Spo0J family partition protein [Candidatus Saccharimonadales bacterium]